MPAVAMIVVCATTCAGFRRQRTLLIFSGLENESKDTRSQHKYGCKNGNFHFG